MKQKDIEQCRTQIGFLFDSLLMAKQGQKEYDGVDIGSVILNDWLHLQEYCGFTKQEADNIDSCLTQQISYGHSRDEAISKALYVAGLSTGLTRRAIYLAGLVGQRGLSDAERAELSRLNE